MENKEIQKRLGVLRSTMAQHKIDYYLISTADYHQSEYVGDYFKVREYFSGFTGSNGTLVVWQDGAGLWTDGRYFIQAERELEGTGITLYRMLQEGVPTIEQFLKECLKPGQKLGFDGRTLSVREGKLYEAIGEVVYDKDLAGDLWENRPALSCEKAWILPMEYAGKTVAEKLQEIRKNMAQQKAETFLLTKLDDIMWLYNLRGGDVECNPVVLSYACVTENGAWFFAQKDAISEEVLEYLQENGIQWKEYDEIGEFLKAQQWGRILLDKRYVNYSLYQVASAAGEVVEGINPTQLPKAIKNSVERAQMEKAYLLDSVAVTKFIYWLKHTMGKEEITEVSAAAYLDHLRAQIPGYVDLSFPTISAYGPNAAMMHYEATQDSFSVLEPKDMLLVDSGGQYLGGTTDVTRTISLGPVPDEIRKHYTLVASGMLSLTHAKWIYGCSGRNLDILARQPLWKEGIDYLCGTGHGVGYLLNVHEGPQSMRWRFAKGAEEVPFEEGMDITNEPGVYIEGSHGIRIENVMVARNVEKNMYGQFMVFDTLTYVPLDKDSMILELLSPEVLQYYKDYQRQVYEKISPFLEPKEADWLKQECL